MLTAFANINFILSIYSKFSVLLCVSSISCSNISSSCVKSFGYYLKYTFNAMFFDDDDERFLNPDLFHVVRRELYAISSDLEVTPYGLRSVPTHTEDGIPIRKIYISNLPPKTTRTELFGVFAQYGFIKSCWLRMGDKGPNKSPVPTYAFVTYSNPADAHKALQAPNHEKILRGRSLKISPADSWHQPAEDADGRVRWKPRGQRRDSTSPTSYSSDQPQVDAVAESSNNSEALSSEISYPTTDQEDDDDEQGYNILEILNRDCISHVLTYVPIIDLIRSERVSKGWQNLVQDYLHGVRIFKTSWWQHIPVTLTTAVLRRVLQRVGGSLLRLHIDHHWSALNDRTAHTVGKFCPSLEELKVVGMHTKNWNPLIYGCKQLKSLSFVSCNKLTDSSLVHLVKNDSYLENLTVANNTHVTGLFLTGTIPIKLCSLAFYNCYSLQGTVLSASIDSLPNLTTLKLDVCPITMWKIIPLILNKLPRLEELSLSEYTSVEICLTSHTNDDFCESLATLSELKSLNLSRNIYITNAVLKHVAQSCHKLQSLNISSCNSKKSFPHPGLAGSYNWRQPVNEGSASVSGVGDEGVSSICRGCPLLAHLDVSYLAALSDGGVASVARLSRLASLTARGNPALSAAPLATCLAACHQLQEMDVCGCDSVSEEVVSAAVRALDAAPRRLALHLAGTAAVACEHEYPTHKLLSVNVDEDRSNPHLRPDFVDRIFDESSDDSLDDIYEHDDYEDFLEPDEDIFLEEDLDEYDEGVYAYGLHAPDIILL